MHVLPSNPKLVKNRKENLAARVLATNVSQEVSTKKVHLPGRVRFFEDISKAIFAEYILFVSFLTIVLIAYR